MKSTLVSMLLAFDASFHGVMANAELLLPRGQSFALRRTNLIEERGLSLNVDCNKLLDQVVGFVSQNPEYAAKVVGIGAGTGLAYNVCQLFKTEEGDSKNCNAVAGIVSSSLTLIVFHGLMVQDRTKDGTTAVPASSRRNADGLAAELEAYLYRRNMDFEALWVEELAEKRDHAGQASHIVKIRQLGDASGGMRADHLISVREDGVGFVQTSPSSTSKRDTGSGFKIAWEVAESGSSIPDNSASNLLCEALASDWAVRADGGDMGDYVGDLKFGGSIGDIRVRIIPEMGPFGEEYEDVNKCNA